MNRKKIPIRLCTIDDFHLKKHSNATINELKQYLNYKIYCAEKSPDAKLVGFKGSIKTKTLKFEIRKCRGPNCKQDWEINDFIKKFQINIIKFENKFISDKLDSFPLLGKTSPTSNYMIENRPY